MVEIAGQVADGGEYHGGVVEGVNEGSVSFESEDVEPDGGDDGRDGKADEAEREWRAFSDCIDRHGQLLFGFCFRQTGVWVIARRAAYRIMTIMRFIRIV